MFPPQVVNGLKDDFSSRTDPSIFTSIAPMLLDQGQTKPIATSCPSPHFLVDQIQVQKSILVAPTDQIPEHLQ